jgi:hypothetical protein
VAEKLNLKATQSYLQAEGVSVSRGLNISGLTFVVKTSDQPCRSSP